MAHLYRRRAQGRPGNDGLVQRFQLTTYPNILERLAPHRPRPDTQAATAAENIYKRLVALDHTKPLRLRLTPDAQALFVDWFTGLEDDFGRAN